MKDSIIVKYLQGPVLLHVSLFDVQDGGDHMSLEMIQMAQQEGSPGVPGIFIIQIVFIIFIGSVRSSRR